MHWRGDQFFPKVFTRKNLYNISFTINGEWFYPGFYSTIFCNSVSVITFPFCGTPHCDIYFYSLFFATKCHLSFQMYSINNELRDFFFRRFRFFEIYSIAMHSQEKVFTKILLYHFKDIITDICERKLVFHQSE